MPMRFLIATLLTLTAGESLAQTDAAEAALHIPAGVRVRLRTAASPDAWIQGALVRADAGSVALVPGGAPAVGTGPLRLPSDSVTRLEVLTGRKRQWLPGLLIGAAVGVAMGLSEPTDPEVCQVDSGTFCNRGSAVAAMGATAALFGTLIGGRFEKDVWTPVPLDALGSPSRRRPKARLGVRPVPGGVSARVSLSF